MDDDNKKHSDQFDAFLPLPDDGNRQDDEPNHAADLIRKKVEAAYTHEPDAKAEFKEAEEVKPAGRSKHQQFIYELTNSGRPLHEIQTAWHEYYAGLTDREKHQVWQEFYNAQTQTARHPAITHKEIQPVPAKPIFGRSAEPEPPAKPIRHRISEARRKAKTTPVRRQSTVAQGAHSLLFGLGIGGIVILIFLFSFFNDRIIAPFIQPSRNSTDIQFISDSSVSKAPEIIIPKINVEIPVVYGVNTIDEASVDKGLENGVVHYADTAEPGQDGNVVIVGHSSNNLFNPGKYKFAFVLLHKLEPGDTFYLQKDGKRYTYQIYKREIVSPTDVSVLGPAPKPASASLITCDPPGTSANRLVVIGEQISPDPASNVAASSHNSLATSSAIIPGNSPSLWSRLVNWFKH